MGDRGSGIEVAEVGEVVVDMGYPGGSSSSSNTRVSALHCGESRT